MKAPESSCAAVLLWVAAATISLTLTVPTAAQTSTEQYSPLAVGPSTRTEFPADPRLDPGQEGTVELWIAARKPAPEPAAEPNEDTGSTEDPAATDTAQPVPPPALPEPLCILQHGSASTGDNFRIEMWPTLAAIYFGRDADWAVANFDFSDGKFHHVAFITAGGTTSIVIDGKLQPRPGDVAYAPPIITGRPLTIGCDDTRDTFDGWLSTIRFWDRALSLSELETVKGFLGLPDQGTEVYDALVAYTTFSDRRVTVSYTQPELLFTPMAGGSDGEVEFFKRTSTLWPAGVFVRRSRIGIGDIMAEYDARQRGIGTFTDRAPLIYSTTPKDDGEHAAVVDYSADLTTVRALPENAADRDAKLAEAQAKLLKWIQILRERRLGFHDDGITTDTGSGENNLYPYGAFRPDPGRNANIVSLIGAHTGSHLVQLRFKYEFQVVDDRVYDHSPLYHYDFEYPPWGSEIFNVSIPPGSRFEGLVVRRNQDVISAVGLAYSFPFHDTAGAVPASVTEGTWVDRNFHEPELVVDLDDAPDIAVRKAASNFYHGTYTSTPYYRIDYNPAAKLLTIWRENPDDQKAKIEVHHFRHEAGNIWKQDLEGQGRWLVLYKDRIHWLGAGQVYERTQQRPAPYEPANRDKISWGGTFSLEQRPTFVEANFKGYNPMRMRARDNQTTTGSTKHIFAMPAETSTDYFTTSNHMIVPHGLFFRLANRGSERSKTIITNSARERSSAWSTQVGLKLGIPLIASFSEDVGYQHEQETMNANEYATGIARTIQSRHALVLDRGRARLAPEFVVRIREFRDQYLNDRDRDYLTFFNAFGTHFANAITYGGMAYLETYYSEQEATDGGSTEVSVKAELSGMIEEILSVGASGSFTKSWKHRFTDKFSNDRAWFDTVGGSISRDQGWTLPRGEEVPLLLDLRPLHTLLGPTFFDDPVIWHIIRPEMETALESYTNAWLTTGLRSWTRAEPGWRSEIFGGTEDLECTGVGCQEQ
jgi:hypothetical protein